MTEITNPHQMPTTLQSPTMLANHLGVPPHALHIFHVLLCATPHILCQKPHDTAPPMLPHGECATLLSDCVIFLPHHKTYIPCHLEASHTWPRKDFSTIPLLTFWPLH